MKTPLNANMNCKSLIQLQLERNQIVENFKHSLANITEQYTVNGNVFGIMYGKPYEKTSGYFVVESEKDELQEAIKEMDSLDKYIRIVENKYQVGEVYSRLSDCPEGKVVDIETQSVVRE